jgi:hypothetical protein
MQIFLQIVGWLGVTIIGVSLPLIYSEIGNEGMTGWSLFFGSAVSILGTVLLLISGFFSRWRYWSIVAVCTGITCIVVALLSLIHVEIIITGQHLDYTFRSGLWVGALMPGVVCIIWGIFRFISNFIYKPWNSWLVFIITGCILTAPYLAYTIFFELVKQPTNAALFNSLVMLVILLPGLVLIIEGIILKLRDKKQITSTT